MKERPTPGACDPETPDMRGVCTSMGKCSLYEYKGRGSRMLSWCPAQNKALHWHRTGDRNAGCCLAVAGPKTEPAHLPHRSCRAWGSRGGRVCAGGLTETLCQKGGVEAMARSWGPKMPAAVRRSQQPEWFNPSMTHSHWCAQPPVCVCLCLSMRPMPA